MSEKQNTAQKETPAFTSISTVSMDSSPQKNSPELSNRKPIRTPDFSAKQLNTTVGNIGNETSNATSLFPIELKATVISETQVNLTWADTLGNKSALRLERTYNGIFNQSYTAFILIPDSHQYNDTSVVASTTYVYRISAVTVAGVSHFSNIVNVTTFDVAPAAPTNFKATASEKSIELRWNDKADNESEYVLKKYNEKGEKLDVFIRPADTESFIDIEVTPSTIYSYSLNARTREDIESDVSSIGSIKTLDAPGFFSTSWFTVLVGIVCCLIAGSGTFVFFSRRESNTIPDSSYALERDLRELRSQRDELRRKLQGIQLKYDQESERLPEMKNRYFRLSSTFQKSKTHLSEVINQIDGQPPVEQFAAYAERVKVLQAINDYVLSASQKEELLRRECLQLAFELKTTEPILSVTVEKMVNSASIDGLSVLKPILLQIKQQEQKQNVSPQINTELAALEKSIEGIRDYSYRLIPSRLIKFANSLIEQPASEKENALREKTVREIIKLINEYLKI